MPYFLANMLLRKGKRLRSNVTEGLGKVIQPGTGSDLLGHVTLTLLGEKMLNFPPKYEFKMKDTNRSK